MATVSRTKGTDVYLRTARIALQERPQLRFEHVGAPDLHRDDGLDEELARLTAEIVPPGSFRMRGSLPAADVLPDWDLFLCSSRSEAFPLATLEAMALGIPVIATTVGGIPEQIEHLESGILVARTTRRHSPGGSYACTTMRNCESALGGRALHALVRSSRSSDRRKDSIGPI